MQGETLTPMVREAVHFASGQNTPEVVEILLRKCALFHPSRNTILHANSRFGEVWKRDGEEIVAKIRDKEAVPEETRALVVSLDGVNVLMLEKGQKRGRKRQRPHENPTEETPTSYQNAMVGSVSLYRSPKQDEKGPQRLSSRYVARMPEEGYPTFRKALEAEVSATGEKLPSGCHKVLLLDGGRGLWSYVQLCLVPFPKPSGRQRRRGSGLQDGRKAADVPKRDAVDQRGRSNDSVPPHGHKILTLGSMLDRIPSSQVIGTFPEAFRLPVPQRPPSPFSNHEAPGAFNFDWAPPLGWKPDPKYPRTWLPTVPPCLNPNNPPEEGQVDTSGSKPKTGAAPSATPTSTPARTPPGSPGRNSRVG